MNERTIVVDQKFRGPPDSGNGGYVAGVLANEFRGAQSDERGAIEVTLRAPTPLDTPLSLQRSGDTLQMTRAATLIAEARFTPLALDIPIPSTWQEALSAREHSYSFPLGINALFPTPRRGVHPICFCCGAEVPVAEGTHVYSAPIPGRRQVAAAWQPGAWLADRQGTIKPEFIWTALDCPGQMAWRAEGVQTGMLGRITARIDSTVRVDERCVIIGWTMGSEGKKYFAGTALFDDSGRCCAFAKAVWIGRVG